MPGTPNRKQTGFPLGWVARSPLQWILMNFFSMELGREAAGTQMAGSMLWHGLQTSSHQFSVLPWPGTIWEYLLLASIMTTTSAHKTQCVDHALPDTGTVVGLEKESLWGAYGGRQPISGFLEDPGNELSFLPSPHKVTWGILLGNAVDLWILLTLGKGGLLFAANSTTGKHFSFP